MNISPGTIVMINSFSQSLRMTYLHPIQRLLVLAGGFFVLHPLLSHQKLSSSMSDLP
jgi:hypothetical protein